MHIYETPPDLAQLAPDAPAELVALIKRMMSKQPAQRPTAREVWDQIDQLAVRAGVSMSSSVPAMSAGRLVPVRGDLPSGTSLGGAAGAVSAPSLGGTIGMATGQTGPQPLAAGPRRWGVLAGGIVAGMVLLGGGALVVQRRAATRAQGVTPPPAPVADKDRDRDKDAAADKKPARRGAWKVESDPPGAQLLRSTDGEVLGTTPWSGAQPEGDAPVQVVLRLAGYRDKEMTLVPSPEGGDRSYAQTLVPKPGAGKKLVAGHGKGGRGAGKTGKGADKGTQDGGNDRPEIAD